jgi:hypothetical protein
VETSGCGNSLLTAVKRIVVKFCLKSNCGAGFQRPLWFAHAVTPKSVIAHNLSSKPLVSVAIVRDFILGVAR